MHNFKNKYFEMINNLEKNKNIEIQNLKKDFRDLSEQHSIKYLKSFEEDYKVILPKEFLSYIFPIYNLSLDWFINNEEFNELSGSLKLIGFSTVISNPLESEYKNNVSQDDAKVLKEGYRFFDRPNEIDRTAIKITNNKIEDKVYFINELNKPQRMSLSYPEYMEHVLKIKGLQHWQYLFIEGLKFKDVQFGLERELGDRLNMLKDVFPSEDFSEYFRLFENMK